MNELSFRDQAAAYDRGPNPFRSQEKYRYPILAFFSRDRCQPFIFPDCSFDIKAH
jgi:hypothetical protein